MFKDSKKRLDVIKMCADCRVSAMAAEDFDPFARAPAPASCAPPTTICASASRLEHDENERRPHGKRMATHLKHVSTGTLDIAYEESGPPDGAPVLLHARLAL